MSLTLMSKGCGGGEIGATGCCTSGPATCGGGGAKPPAEFVYMLNFLGEMFPKLHERRVLPRTPYVAATTIVTEPTAAEGPAEQHDVYTRDVNPYNAGFVSTQPIEVGTRVVVRIDLPNGRRFETRARVHRCREFTPGCFEGYVNFSDAMPEQMMALIRE